MNELDGRVIAIAGAGGGLGPVVAMRLADAGATLAIGDVSEGRAREVADRVGLSEARVDAAAVDLLDESSTAAWRDSLIERFGQVDGLIHLVGGWRGGDPIESFDLSDYEFLHDLLVRTVQIASRAFHGPLTSSDHGRFVLVSSAQAQNPEGTNAAYAATKAAAETWTLALADSFAKAGSDDDGKGGANATANIVVVNAILTEAMREKSPDKTFPAFTPTEDIAEAIALLCSDRGARMNGKRLDLYP